MKSHSLALIAACGVMFVSAGCGRPEGTKPPASSPPAAPDSKPVAHAPDRDRELMVTDLSVVNDARTQGPDGPWSFGKLMQGLAGTSDPAQVSKFVVSWLTTWDAKQTVNSFDIPARPQIRSLVIDAWKAKDGQPGVSDALWQPKLENAPFRLLAIVNRLDLNRGTPARVDSAGEGRFVFGVVKPDGDPALFTVIFEYELLAKTREELRGWARAWHALGTIPFGPEYNAALEKITNKFSGAGGAPGKPNKSALNQLRTNEIELVLLGDAAKGWELREFTLSADDGLLHQVTVKQSPSNSFQNTADLAQFINSNIPQLLDHSLFIADKLDGGQPFLAGAAVAAPPAPTGFFWNAPGIQNNEARHQLALLTCNGCHHLETNTGSFLHVSNRKANEEAVLSGFLTGIDAPDPIDTAIKRPFHDLDDRAEILKLLAEETGDAVGITLQGLQASRAARVH